MDILRYTGEKKGEWDAFVSEAKNSLFMFKRDYMEYHSDRFTDHSLMFYEEDKLMALLPADVSGDVLCSHGGLTYGGFLLKNDAKQHTVNDCMTALKEHMKEEGLKKLVYKCIPHVYHLQPAEEDEYALFANGARLTAMGASTVLDLKAPIKMPKGRKAQISRAKREGVVIERRTDKESFEEFIGLENEVLTARHNVKAVHTADELYLLYSRFPENIALYAAVKDEHIIAGCVCYLYKETVHVQYMAADEEARRIGALDLAVATVMETYAADHKWLDFGISTEDGGSFLNEGLISQKEGFGGRTNVYRIWELLV
ncbi:MAG: GNAT family N-acetyltransferase [Lachnospiraceae bacterium]|nr:GNAT family N-acetyltransferase [Lachnospiraceae bacterium]